MDALILTAAGRSTRFGGTESKVLMPLGDRTVIAHALARFREVVPDLHVVVTAKLSDHEAIQQELPKVHVVEGGDTRGASVSAGFAALPDDVEVVAVHDGARPLTPRRIIQEVFEMARRFGAAAAVRPMTDTLHRIGASTLEGHITLEKGIDRTGLVAAQTPQAAQYDLLERALAKRKARDAGATDEVTLLLRAGVEIVAVEGDRRNLKITTRDDLAVAEALLAQGAPE